MTVRRSTRCPSPARVERAYWSSLDDHRGDTPTPDLAIEEHINDCATCTSAWREIAALAQLAGAIAPPDTAPRRDALRTTLLATLERKPQLATRTRRWWVMAPMMASAAALIVWLWPAGSVAPDVTAPQATVRRGFVLEHHDAKLRVVSTQPDEIVRVIDGELTVDVPKLDANERFRIISGDAEIESSGAAFDVTVREDRLVAVRVLRGRVEIRSSGVVRTLDASQIWRSDLAVIAPSVPPPTTPATPPDSTATSNDPIAPAIARSPSAEIKPVRPADERPETPSATSPEPPPRSTPPPTPARLAFDQGWRALRTGDFMVAANELERTLKLTGDGEAELVEDATHWLAVALARGGETARAEAVFLQFLDRFSTSPRVAEVSVMLGWLLYKRGDDREAARRFGAGERDPSPRIRESAAAGLRALAARKP